MLYDKNSLFILKNTLVKLELDYIILPSHDEFNSEYLPDYNKRLEFITGFSGSNGMAIVSSDIRKSIFFTDGRYMIQAKNELNLEEFEIYNQAEFKINEIIPTNSKIGVMEEVCSKSFFDYLCQHFTIIQISQVIIDEIWEKSKIFLPQSQSNLQSRPKYVKQKIFHHHIKYSGENSMSKRARIIAHIKEDAVFIPNPDEVCWLLNIRSFDVKYTPLLLCYALLNKDLSVDLFVNSAHLSNKILSSLENVRIFSFDEVKNIIFNKNSVLFYESNLKTYNILKISDGLNPIKPIKAVKNKMEISGAIRAHKIDSKALIEFIQWFKNTKKSNFTEIAAAKKLLEFRQKHREFLYPSFETISSFSSNGAIIHYKPTEKSNKIIKGSGLYLFDSGGQYQFGTTDVTRVVLIGNATKEMIKNYTLVLKGHIAIAMAKFPIGTSGAQIDVLARQFLWQNGLNYDHGTGHGVGNFLSVHEGPQAISRHNSVPLREGMILSNEPGYYKNDHYGIRIENLMLVQKSKFPGFLEFKTLTLVPFEHELIDIAMLNHEEKKWIKNYYHDILKYIKPYGYWLFEYINKLLQII